MFAFNDRQKQQKRQKRFHILKKIQGRDKIEELSSNSKAEMWKSQKAFRMRQRQVKKRDEHRDNGVSNKGEVSGNDLKFMKRFLKISQNEELSKEKQKEVIKAMNDRILRAILTLKWDNIEMEEGRVEELALYWRPTHSDLDILYQNGEYYGDGYFTQNLMVSQ